jgi:hypothetical protein
MQNVVIEINVLVLVPSEHLYVLFISLDGEINIILIDLRP